MRGNRNVVLYIAMSLDGYIAKPDGDISFLSLVEKEGEDYGYDDFLKSVDTVIIGRKTYDHVIEMGYDYPDRDKEVYIITRSERPDIGTIKYYTGSLKELVTSLKVRDGRNIYCDGGAEIVNELLKDQLIDEFIISVIPVLLGDGVSLFKNLRPESQLKFIKSKQYESGLVQLHYERLLTNTI
jgi:dihydrofolate reductase